MPRILIRAGKRPEDYVSAETTLALNNFGSNSGNYLFSYSAYRMLSRADTEIVPFGLGMPRMAPEQINDEFDHVVLPMANSFRPAFMKSLDSLSEFIQKLTIPVTVLSVGAQATTDNDVTELTKLNDSVKRFVGTVLDHGPRIGVRGAFTAEYLTSLGFSDVEAIGCPSFFLNGPSIDVADPSPDLNYDSRVSFSVTPGTSEMGPITTDHMRKFRNLRLIPQDSITLASMLWGTEPKNFGASSEMPFHPRHPLFVQDKARFFVDPLPWIDYMKTIDFAFGDRIHGNVAPILAGTPSFLLAHDSRVLELAQHHGIPHMLVGDVTPGMDALDFAARADYKPLRSMHPARWAIFERYLSDHGLSHTFDTPEDQAKFDARLRDAPTTGPIHAIEGAHAAHQVGGQIEWLYKKLQNSEAQWRRDHAKSTREIERLEKLVGGLQTELAEVRRGRENHKGAVLGRLVKRIR